MPRSLNEPVGFVPSVFRYTWQPVIRDSTGAGSNGVPPSPSVTTASAGTGGRLAAYSATTPRHACAARPSSLARATLLALFALDAQDAVHRAHRLHRRQVGDGLGERGLAG